YVAGFFHNSIMWESEIGHARHFKTFMGVSCLHDAPYMAMYECFESFAGFDEYLQQAGSDLDPAVRMRVSEYCECALVRAWVYYSAALPTAATREGGRQGGVLNRERTVPLEDLSPDGRAAGQLGQEIYGSGAASVFATRSHHPVDSASCRLYRNQ